MSLQHPLLQLQALLAPRKARSTGRVVRTEGGEVHVATSKGLVIAQRRGDGTEYKLGDMVVMKEGELSGRLRDEADIPVFFI